MVDVPAGVTRLKVPPGWAVEPGGASGKVELVVEQSHAWNDGGVPFDPCAGWPSSGVRLEKTGNTWVLTAYGIGETASEASTVVGVVLAPPGLEGSVDPALYPRSEAARRDDRPEPVALLPDRGHVAEVWGPLLAQENPDTYLRNAGRAVFASTAPYDGDVFARIYPFAVDTERQEVADAILADLRAQVAPLEACFAPIARAAPELAGTSGLYFTIRPDGSVGYATLVGGVLDQVRWNRLAKALELPARECLLDALRKLTFTNPADRELFVMADVSTPTASSQLGVVRP